MQLYHPDHDQPTCQPLPTHFILVEVTCGPSMQLEAVLGFNGGAALEWRPDLGLLAYGAANAVVLELHSATRQRFSLPSPSLTRATVRPDESSLHAITHAASRQADHVSTSCFQLLPCWLLSPLLFLPPSSSLAMGTAAETRIPCRIAVTECGGGLLVASEAVASSPAGGWSTTMASASPQLP